ncbi:MAG: hypothetical protein ACRDXC_00975, partial [Acidimicrobiales bacterium]
SAPGTRNRRRSYATYSVGCATAWIVLLGVLAASGKNEELHKVLPVCGGWWLGWTSATIACRVYPWPSP